MSTQKLVNTIKSFINVARNKINLQKTVAFLYIYNEQQEKEYRNTIPFIVASKKNQISSSKLNKGLK
jgi:hypothetical protein